MNRLLKYIGKRDQVTLDRPYFTKRYFFKKGEIQEMATEDDFLNAIRLEGICLFERVDFENSDLLKSDNVVPLFPAALPEQAPDAPQGIGSVVPLYPDTPADQLEVKEEAGADDAPFMKPRKRGKKKHG